MQPRSLPKLTTANLQHDRSLNNQDSLPFLQVFSLFFQRTSSSFHTSPEDYLSWESSSRHSSRNDNWYRLLFVSSFLLIPADLAGFLRPYVQSFRSLITILETNPEALRKRSLLAACFQGGTRRITIGSRVVTVPVGGRLSERALGGKSSLSVL